MRRGFLLTVLVLAIGLAALWPTVLSLVGYWEDTDNLTYTHGYLIAAITAWLVWRARPELELAPPRPSWLAIVATALLGLVWYLAWISGIEVGHQVLLPPILLAAVAGVVGFRAAGRVAFALGYLYFAVPVWSLINGELQSLTTLGVTFLVRVTGLPAYIEGNFVHVPSGSFEIAGGCSGVHFFIVALAIAALYGELDRDRLRNRVRLVVIAAAMAIVMNWVRVYTIILNGHLTDMQGFLVRVDHYYFGWALFGVLLVAFFWIARRLLPPPPARAAAHEPTHPSSAHGVAASLAATVLALAAGPALAYVATLRAQSAQPTATLTLPAGAGDWQGPSQAGGDWQPVFQHADAEAAGLYRRGDATVIAYANFYASQAQGREIVGTGNDILGADLWQVEASLHREPDPAVAGARYIELTATTPARERWIVGYFYTVGGRNFTSDLTSKLYYGGAVLAGRPGSGVVAAASRCEASCESAAAAVHDFMSGNAQALADALRKGH